MSACSFSVPFTKPAAEILAKAKQAVESQGGNFTGNDQGGNFNVSVLGNTVVGSYSVAEQSLLINISEKPFLVPCSMIESFLKGQLS